MSRRRPGSGATISLFPFLAVLLCTMGSLLVLLVIFSRQAQESQTAAAREAEQARVEELKLARDELRWRLEQLHGVRDRTAADLARERMRLAGVEQDARKLADELDALERRALALEETGPAADAEVVADAERRLAAARSTLEQARQAGAQKPAAYAVVPYEGANGTHRRPLYVECCIDGVFLQPEGIRLGPADFEGPPGPGNPLASGLRAAREYLARNPQEAGDPGTQPYPLLLVRPSGVMAYYAAREALVSWGSEFGYQFVDEDWQLRYPPADPALADVEQRAIEESRRRMEWLAQVRPARPARPTQQFRASTTRGGVVAEGGPSVLGDPSRFEWTDEQAGAAGRHGDSAGAIGGDTNGSGGGDVVLGGGGGGRGDGRSGAPGTGATGRAGGGGVGGNAGDRYAGPSRFYSGQPPAAGAAGGSGGLGGPHQDGSHSSPGAAGAAAAAAGAGPANTAATAGAGGASSSAGGAAGQAGATASGASGSSGATGSAGASGSSGGMASMGAAGASGGGGGGPSLPGMMQAGASASCGGAGSLAGSRGSNWASLATADRPVPLTRPIRVECAADEFRVFDDGGTHVETRIPIGTRTADSVDPLVQAVHGRVGRWGLAGERMYWRPELVLSETADGRSRREDLERLLADSGIDIRRDAADGDVRPLPPVARTTAATLNR
jgi:hypothetical protein